MSAEWRPDPDGRFEYRWWDGQAWTDQVATGGVVQTAPLQASTPEAIPGSEAAGAPGGGAATAQPAGEPVPEWAGGPPAQPSAQEPSTPEWAGGQPQQSAGQPQPQQWGGQPSQPQDQGWAAQPGEQAYGQGTQPQDQGWGGQGGQAGPGPQAYGQGGPTGQAQPQPQGQGWGQPGPSPQAYGQGPQAQPAQGGTLRGALLDGTYAEKDAEPIANQNSKMLRVRLTGAPVMARQGSMVAYQGPVDFNYEGAGGAAKWLKKAVTGEGLPLMRIGGQGEVFLADSAYDVHLLFLENSGISVNGRNVLAFGGLEWDIERVQGAGIMTGGLFNTTLRGSGWVAITTDGPPVVLQTDEAPTFADTQAVIAWSAHLQTAVRSTFKAAALIGRGSGELMQISFQGSGFVIVQPSEGIQIPTGQA